MFVDVHAHLDFDVFAQDLDTYLEQWTDEGLEEVIANGIDKESNRDVRKISASHDMVKAAFGFHPEAVLETSMDDIHDELEWIAEQDPIAIGEVGLDHKYADSERERKKQMMIFKRFIELSKQTGKPLIIHSRKAEREVIETLLDNNHTNAVLHCYFGKKNLMKKAADNGLWFSAPSISHKAQQLKDMVQYVPLDQLLTETDSPYLGPSKDEVNTPVTIKHTIDYLAQVKEMSREKVAQTLFNNYKQLFKH